jgi:hypothetical protein
MNSPNKIEPVGPCSLCQAPNSPKILGDKYLCDEHRLEFIASVNNTMDQAGEHFTFQPDPFTTTMRLCDDQGQVSHALIDAPEEPKIDGTYLERLNALRDATSHGGSRKPVTTPFTCTGHAHLAGEHILCTSPIHTVSARTLIADPLPPAPSGECRRCARSSTRKVAGYYLCDDHLAEFERTIEADRLEGE